MSDDPKRGLYAKYHVQRTDGQPIGYLGCIVLELKDPNAWPALLVWADTVEAAGYEKLAAETRERIADFQRAPGSSAQVQAGTP